jgi:lysyl-tRNA synthetase class 2
VSTRGPDPRGLRARAAVLAALRRWFDDHGYLEVPTAVLVPSPALEENLYAVPAGGGFLRTSPEFALKRVLAAGLPRIYEIGPCFREEEHGPWHRREFTMLEWYRAGASLDDLMDEVESLVAVAAAALGVAAPRSWARTTVRALVQTHTGLDLATATTADLSPADPDWDTAFYRRWIEDVEPELSGPTFVSEWPASQAALAQVRAHRDWPVACRFEAFLGGVELANAFLELGDSAEQARRFHKSAAVRRARGEPPHPTDEALVEAVGRIPPTAGIALGVDRLVTVLLGDADIGTVRV